LYAQFPADGAALFQDIAIPSAEGRCFLLNFGYRIGGLAQQEGTLAEVRWLDNTGREIGLGLSLVIPNPSPSAKWLVYTGITEPAPPGTKSARVQFTNLKSEESNIDIDKVVFGSLAGCSIKKGSKAGYIGQHRPLFCIYRPVSTCHGLSPPSHLLSVQHSHDNFNILRLFIPGRLQPGFLFPYLVGQAQGFICPVMDAAQYGPMIS